MPVEGVVASLRNHGFASGLIDLTEVYVPEFPSWDQSILVKASNIELLKPYMTDERLRALQALMTIKTVISTTTEAGMYAAAMMTSVKLLPTAPKLRGLLGPSATTIMASPGSIGRLK